jgi:hypothetical protein
VASTAPFRIRLLINSALSESPLLSYLPRASIYFKTSLDFCSYCFFSFFSASLSMHKA